MRQEKITCDACGKRFYSLQAVMSHKASCEEYNASKN